MDPNVPLSIKDIIRKELSNENSSGSNSVKLVDLKLSTLSDSTLSLLSNVERLSLRRNQLSSLPEGFVNLKKLRYLDLNGNEFREVPSVLYDLPNLEILDMSQNKIKLLPQQEVNIFKYWNKNLKILSLKNNRIQSVNNLLYLTKLENLTVLDVEGNYIPKEELDMVLSMFPQNNNTNNNNNSNNDNNRQDNNIHLPSEEIWMYALRKYASSTKGTNSNNTQSSSSKNSNNTNSNKAKTISKRMGFINVNTLTPNPTDKLVDTETDPTNNIMTPSSINGNIDLYNHSKYNDYFKRLSILPEECSVNETHKASHAEIVVCCRKLLFSFTECQQSIRKIASFCKDKAIAVNVVSLLYSVRSHIDHLLELLEEAENETNFNDQEMIKLCITILTYFKQLVSNLRKNFNTFFLEDDLCFIRMFYMTLLCSYNEIYNAWCFISNSSDLEAHQILQQQQEQQQQQQPSIKSTSSLSRKQTLKRNESSASLFLSASQNSGFATLPAATDSNGTSPGHMIENTVQKTRVRSNTLQSKVLQSHPIDTTRSFSNITNLSGATSNSNNNSNSNANNNNVLMSTNLHEHTNHPSGNIITHGQSPLSGSSTVSGNSSASLINVNENNLTTGARNTVSDHKNKIVRSPMILTSQVTSSQLHSRPEDVNTLTSGSIEMSRSHSSVSNTNIHSTNSSTNVIACDNDSKTSLMNKGVETGMLDKMDQRVDEVSEAQKNIDIQLYQILTSVIKMVSVVYNQLTGEISKIAVASTNGQKILTESLSSKIKDLTDTCWQAMELSKSLNDRLKLLLSPDANITEKYLTTVEKLKTWEKINAFLKSIISILGNTKEVMSDLPSLNEIRPNLASLAKITKDVTVILDLSSYKSVTVTAAQIQKQQQQQQQYQHTAQQQRQLPYQYQQQINSNIHVPLLTPQPNMQNPFDNVDTTKE